MVYKAHGGAACAQVQPHVVAMVKCAQLIYAHSAVLSCLPEHTED